MDSKQRKHTESFEERQRLKEKRKKFEKILTFIGYILNIVWYYLWFSGTLIAIRGWTIAIGLVYFISMVIYIFLFKEVLDNVLYEKYKKYSKLEVFIMMMPVALMIFGIVFFIVLTFVFEYQPGTQYYYYYY